MKSIIALLSIFTIITTAGAQVKVGVKGGWNYSTAKAVYTGVNQSTDYTNGFGLGVLAKVPFDGILHFSPSVMINNRGFIIKPSTGTNKKEQYSITYLDLIPALSVDFENGNNTVSIALGPDFGFTNFGKLKATDMADATTSEKMKFGYGGYGWFDLGLNTSVAYRMKKVFVELAYFSGLANINNNEEIDGRNIRNRMLSLNIGYYFKQTATQ
jgi:hypothetical protein